MAETVEGTLPGLQLQLLHQDFSLLVHHLQEVGQDGEVKGGSQHLPPATPLGASAAKHEEHRRWRRRRCWIVMMISLKNGFHWDWVSEIFDRVQSGLGLSGLSVSHSHAISMDYELVGGEPSV